MIEKTVQDSITEQVHILMPENLNGYGRLFGGRLMQWIDEVAGVTARRHSGCNVTTAAVSELQFHAAAHVNDVVVLEGRILRVGNTSMEVQVDTFVERPGERVHINRAKLVMVALDENERPTPVPKLRAGE
ncbi:MAG: acyl-CoA thioesterase [Oscillospiraceae bacterium]|nr:acyl-CoA thioesterase [Oscillospiraceae bacterium]